MSLLKFCVITLLCFSFTTAYSQSKQTLYDDLTIENARARATIPGVKVSAGYLKLTNNTDKTMHFTTIKSNAAKFSEFHNMVMDNNKMVMRKIDSIDIEPHQSFVFKEKSYHLMFMGLNQRFIPGDSISVTLIQDNGKEYEVLLPVMELNKH